MKPKSLGIGFLLRFTTLNKVSSQIFSFFVPAYDICKLKYSINNVILYLFSQGGVLHVVNGPFSSEALGFTFSLNSSTEMQRWKPRLVRPF